jgi:soluble lytic murein transglycosylase-like protein
MCYVLFSPLAVIRIILTGQERSDTSWVRGFLVFGLIAASALSAAILLNQAADGEVFAALGRFEAEPEKMPANASFSKEINAAASRYKLNPMAVGYIIQIESGGQPLLVSNHGARGLMQILPGTWRFLSPDSVCRGNHPPMICAAGADCIFAPWGNVRAGSLYLASLLRKNHGDYVAAVQAYNAGPGNVVFGPEAKFPETKKYVATFLQFYRALQKKQLLTRLAATARARRLLHPLLWIFAGYFTLATAFFWRHHRKAA